MDGPQTEKEIMDYEAGKAAHAGCVDGGEKGGALAFWDPGEAPFAAFAPLASSAELQVCAS